MNSISKNGSFTNSVEVFRNIEEAFSIKIRDDVKEFITINSGGYPIKDVIEIDGEEYEVRVFLSSDSQNKNYYIGKPLEYFLKRTNGKIIPIAIDSGDNYYCVNNETGKVYYWSAGEDSYFEISESLEDWNQKFR